MVLLHTPDCEFNKKAPGFALPDMRFLQNQNIISLEDIQTENGFLVMFICNHCPYVKAIITRLVHDCNYLLKQNIGVVAIMSNDYQSYPEDSPEKMAEFAKLHDMNFPYLLDKNQSIAKQYDAICTPDFFGFDKEHKLQYRGRFDSSGMQANQENNTPELRNAMLAIAEGKKIEKQIPSMGCSIKWYEN